jgi:F0F1-type ATP synthase membrane subunit c/vacuolar-type H+-ATPase subunit K
MAQRTHDFCVAHDREDSHMQDRCVARQGGWSIFSAALAVAVAVVFFMVGLAMYPGYYEAFAVRKAVNSLAEDATIGQMGKPAIWSLLEKRFDMSGLYTPTPTKDNLKLDYDKKTGKKRIVVEYDYVRPVFANISVMLHFRHELQVEGTVPGDS